LAPHYRGSITAIANRLRAVGNGFNRLAELSERVNKRYLPRLIDYKESQGVIEHRIERGVNAIEVISASAC
jgi:hypothetical protein